MEIGVSKEVWREVCRKAAGFGEPITKLPLEKNSYGGQLVRLFRPAGWIVPVSLLSVFALTVLFHNTPAVSAQTG